MTLELLHAPWNCCLELLNDPRIQDDC